ncbi:pancreatic triacylglycerol lipase-like [Adelges cooleyi]|uniref:pancreatic triacylglycerol lipase-like n=1 Tax=Adelges cooleyi TaxID=133065 RepID=UPI00217F3F36|nr:pancreatic triacylglycerol lipase-like [Adelges cooleyi]
MRVIRNMFKTLALVGFALVTLQAQSKCNAQFLGLRNPLGRSNHQVTVGNNTLLENSTSNERNNSMLSNIHDAGFLLVDSAKNTGLSAIGEVKDTNKAAIDRVKETCNMTGGCIKGQVSRLVDTAAGIIDYSKTSISDIISKSKCVIPKDADNIVRAALLQQCVSPSFGYGNESRCFDELGCFPMDYPWVSILRPFPMPMRPDEIDVKLYLYTRKQPDRFNVKLWPNMSVEGSDFDPKRPYTAFITHGFSSDGNSSWLADLKDGYLKHRDANIFLVDWGKGASSVNYLQVASNTRIVGAELARFGKYLIEKYGLETSRMHLMGHSLGAHISSYFAKALSGVARITAFDPAQPGFEGCPVSVKLDKSDADFVDVIHTSCRPTIPLLGFGLIGTAGHVDVYMNGGFVQPGCTLPPVDTIKLTSISDLALIPVDVLSSWVACSHGRSYLYWIESLTADQCTFWGRKAKILSAITSVASIGQLESITSLVLKCKFEECIPLGLDADEYPARGIFTASTGFFTPYCKVNAETDKYMRSELVNSLDRKLGNDKKTENSKKGGVFGLNFGRLSKNSTESQEVNKKD